ncbi:MAG: hypothetical protein IPM46_15940 [Flavobacteriales bacterium]|nr:hypothetical protein [Flavobacteriales bacterium]
MRHFISMSTNRPCGSALRVPLIGIITILVVFASCSTTEPPADAPTLEASATTVTLSAEQLENAGIVSGKAERRSLGVLMPVQGVVDVPPQNRVSISAPLGGYLRSTDLLPGMEIQKGQTLGSWMIHGSYSCNRSTERRRQSGDARAGFRAPEGPERVEDEQRQGASQQRLS